MEVFMKARLASILIAALAVAPAAAGDLDFSKISCKEFLAAPKDQASVMLAWLQGFYTKENDAPIMFAEKSAGDAKKLTEYCGAHAEDDMIKAADAVMPAN
jgi:hypothetical protein